MAARVIHFGIDESHRLTVLRRAGYEIEKCSSVVQLRAALHADVEADAVMVNDLDGSVPEDAISLARSHSSAPLILFPNPDRSYSMTEFDLVVPRFTPPEEWLLDLANLIVKARTLRAHSQLLAEHGPGRGKKTAVPCHTSRKERARPGKECNGKSAFDTPLTPESEPV
jgi:hypothetical protein